MDQVALIALGANLDGPAGSPSNTLSAALQELGDCEGCSVVAVSRFWNSPAYPPGAGPDYINAVAAIESRLTPEVLLERLHEIEALHGRTRETRWGARVLDLDLLAVGQTVLPSKLTWRHWRDLDPKQQRQRAPDQLVLPHPRMQDRAFVLVPLAEIAADWRHPVTGLTVSQMCRALPGEEIAALTPMT